MSQELVPVGSLPHSSPAAKVAVGVAIALIVAFLSFVATSTIDDGRAISVLETGQGVNAARILNLERRMESGMLPGAAAKFDDVDSRIDRQDTRIDRIEERLNGPFSR